MLYEVITNRLLPNKEKTGKASGPAVSGIRFNFMPLIYALIAMGVFAAGLSFIVGLADGLAFGLFAGFITWILTFSGKDEKPRIVSLILVFSVITSYSIHYTKLYEIQ